ncbi:zinc finger CCCH domain-containing protein 62-like [Quillaja saponaria]|uniref:Zinc finger CCCH domain-containing protein 62-like n=1 Tax=Quillaja saponaria TaxID=32244 RepID=A0AAD7KRI8_QUISA|nr:zinc finger CCCH domain-containing protein 62-like [Quillaja saponaria]
MAETKGKGTIILLSSSSDEEVVDGDDGDGDEEEEIDDGDTEEDGDYDDDDSSGEDSSEEDKEDTDGDDGSFCNKVICLLQEGNDLASLKLKECKAYLRKHGLRIAGTKSICVERIKEHWRIRNGNGETLYPRSSFIINCTGDVCKGDTLLFRQKVYEKFDKVTRYGRLLGKRAVAGRVVKESYGAAKQQHTFTIEVIWSSGVKKLPPLFPLLVKGRNLYRLKTFRQVWKDEAERVKVLTEKHERGAAARLVRTMKQKKKKWTANGGVKRPNEVQHTRPTKLRRTGEIAMSKVHAKRNDCQSREAFPSRQAKWNQNAISGTLRSTRGSVRTNDKSYAHSSRSRYPSQLNSQSRTEPYRCFSNETGFIPHMMELPPLRPYVNVMPTSQHLMFNNGNDTHFVYPNPRYD